MAIKVYTPQVNVNKQSSFIESQKLPRDYGQDVFEGIQGLAQGASDVAEFFFQKEQLKQKTEKDKIINDIREESIRVENEMDNPNGEFQGDFTSSNMDEFFDSYMDNYIKEQTLNLSGNFKQEVINTANSQILQAKSRIGTTQTNILKNEALTGAVQAINKAIDEVDYNSTASVSITFDTFNNEMEAIAGLGLYDALQLEELRTDTLGRLLEKAITSKSPVTGYVDYEELLTGEKVDPILSPILAMLENDLKARDVFDAVNIAKINRIENEQNNFKASALNWVNENQDIIQWLNSNEAMVRAESWNQIQAAHTLNLITTDLYTSYANIANSFGSFAVVDDMAVIMDLQNKISTKTLTLDDLAGIDRSKITQATYNSMFSTVNTYHNAQQSDARTYLYSIFNVETAMLDSNNSDHQVISAIIKKVDGDYAQYMLGDMEALNAEYPDKDISKMPFSQFSIYAANEAFKQAKNVRINALIAKVKQFNEYFLGPDSLYPYLPPLNAKNINKWFLEAIEKGMPLEDEQELRGMFTIYNDLLDGWTSE